DLRSEIRDLQLCSISSALICVHLRASAVSFCFAHALAVLEEWLDADVRLAFFVEDRLGGVLGEIHAAGLVGTVEAAAVEAGAGEDGDGAGGADHRVAGVVA